MKRVLLSLLAAATLMTSVPSQAGWIMMQSYDYRTRNEGATWVIIGFLLLNPFLVLLDNEASMASSLSEGLGQDQVLAQYPDLRSELAHIMVADIKNADLNKVENKFSVSAEMLESLSSAHGLNQAETEHLVNLLK